MSVKVPKASMQEWGIEEEEVWESAMSNTYVMAPPRIYLKPMDLVDPPYHRGAFMALNSDITSLSPRAVPTVTTTMQINGAIAMFYPRVMKRIAELFGDDYYIAFTGTSEARLQKKGTVEPRNILKWIKLYEQYIRSIRSPVVQGLSVRNSDARNDVAGALNLELKAFSSCVWTSGRSPHWKNG